MMTTATTEQQPPPRLLLDLPETERTLAVGRTTIYRLVAREDEEYAERARAHRERFRHLRPVPSLPRQRERVTEARRPRPDDYPGRAS